MRIGPWPDGRIGIAPYGRYMHAPAATTYPRPLSGWLSTGTAYDLVNIEDLGGAVAVRADDGVSESVVRAARRAGYAATTGARRVPAAQLPRVAPRLLWVNPTAADLLRLRWISWPEDSRGLQRSSATPNGSATRGTE